MHKHTPPIYFNLTPIKISQLALMSSELDLSHCQCWTDRVCGCLLEVTYTYCIHSWMRQVSTILAPNRLKMQERRSWIHDLSLFFSLSKKQPDVGTHKALPWQSQNHPRKTFVLITLWFGNISPIFTIVNNSETRCCLPDVRSGQAILQRFRLYNFLF